ncbi:MAG: ornithine carbamoyltransferase [Halanaerobiaceae bacterium]|jgi:ornithine carbamoyltransferase|nr:ornithine carbamoyltransferase [Halanaerobiaceae bacterium]
MGMNLSGRSFLTLKDFSHEEIDYLLDLSGKLKEKKKRGEKGNLLDGKNIALLFEKTSTRTRIAFAVAVYDEGGKAEFLGKNDIQLGEKESVKDTARVLGRIFDGIEYRGYEHKNVEILAEYSGVPVWNGLTDSYHPTQVLADFLTIKEEFGFLKGIKLVYIGDGRNNVANSLLIGSGKMGVNCTIIAPEELWPESSIVNMARIMAKESGSEINISPELDAVHGADVIYTDVWFSIGEEDKIAERIELLKPYQVNMELLNKAENESLIFLHCLPAFHNRETEIGEMVYQNYGLAEMEVTDEVFESSFSRVFEQAENRMHTIKAVMVATLCSDLDL